MERLFFLVPDPNSAKQIVDELLLARVEARHIHAIAKGTPMQGVPEATLVQTSDLIPALERGVAAGGATGLIAGLIAVAFRAAGLALGGGAVLAITLVGAGFGALMSTMVGIGIPSSRLEQFQKAIEKGDLLMMVDVSKARVDEIQTLVTKRHPEAMLAGARSRAGTEPFKREAV
jgi:hypothetical protein